MKPLATAFSALALLVAFSSMPSPALAFDDDLDDLGDDLLDAPKGSVKTKAPADVDADADPEFDFGDDPDWDAGPDPVEDVDEFGEDPPEDAGVPADEFDFGDDPPDDFIQAPPTPSTSGGAGDPLDDDPPADLGPAGAAAPTLGLGVATKGMTPLADNYPAAIVGKDLDAVVVELPILVASKPTDVDADYWLVTEIRVGDRKVGETRHYVSRQSVADMGPTLVWLKSVVPVLERTGKLELRVSQAPVDAGEETPLFTKSVNYAL